MPVSYKLYLLGVGITGYPTIRYMAHDTDNIMMHQFYDNRYIYRQSYNDTSCYLSNFENKMPVKRLSVGSLSSFKSKLLKILSSIGRWPSSARRRATIGLVCLVCSISTWLISAAVCHRG